ncbi:MAG: DUF1684 domain-containing protein [Bacillota bacterium]
MVQKKEIKNSIRAKRKEKDRFFKEHSQSPLSSSQKKKFTGLNYFPVRLEYRFKLKLSEHDKKETIEVNDNAGNKQQYIRWGEFKFELDEKPVVLQAYKGDSNEDRLWVPFKDETNGNKTYGAGRYLDLNTSEKEGKHWILDFNQAYNPFCAYNENFVCPFIPPENWLEVKIEAGEKKFEL